MTLGLISDVHGNYEALRAVLAALDGMGVTEVISLGDVVGYYSQVNECCDALRARGVRSVMGNHDWYLGSGGACPRSKSVNDCLAYLRKVVTAENVEWLRSFPVEIRTGDLRVVHGGWSDPIDEYLKWTEDYFTGIPGTRFASGHTHVPMIRSSGGKTYCNPGSVGQPRDHDPRASFATYADGEFVLHRVEYDFERVFELMERAGFSDYYYGSLKTGAPRLGRLT